MHDKEKLDKKYGRPSLRVMAERTAAAKNYYGLYLEAQRQIHIDRIEAIIAYVISLFLLGISFWATGFLISSVMFLVVAVHATLDARIETLWSTRFVDGIFEAVRLFNLEEKVAEMEKEK